jgi:hypothetical protein
MWLGLFKLLGTLLDGVLKVLPLLLVSKQAKELGKVESENDSLKTINKVNSKSEQIVKDVRDLSDDELYSKLYNKN